MRRRSCGRGDGLGDQSRGAQSGGKHSHATGHNAGGDKSGRGTRQAAAEIQDAASASGLLPAQSIPWAKCPPLSSKMGETPSPSLPGSAHQNDQTIFTHRTSPSERSQLPPPPPSPQQQQMPTPPTAAGAGAAAGEFREAKGKGQGRRRRFGRGDGQGDESRGAQSGGKDSHATGHNAGGDKSGRGTRQAAAEIQDAVSASGLLPAQSTPRLTLEFSGLKRKIPPKRPDRGGTLGKPVTVEANCWDMTIKDTSVLMYDIEAIDVLLVSGGKKSRPKSTSKDLHEYLQEVTKRLPSTAFYDGGRIIYSVKPLPNVSEQKSTVEVSVPDPLGRGELVLKYAIMQVGRVSARGLQDYVNDENSCTFNLPQDSINMVACIIKNVNKRDYVVHGGTAAYIKKPLVDDRRRLFVIHRGFLVSCRPQWKVRLNIDVVHKAFFPSGNLADILYDSYGNRMYDRSSWEAMARDIQGIRCEASHYRNANGTSWKRRVTAHGLSENSAEEEIIQERGVSVAAYFLEKYDIALKYPELPCVKTKRDRAVFVPMELLTVLPFQKPNADKDDIISEIIKCAAVQPQDRFNLLNSYVDEFVKKQKELKELFQLNTNPLTPVKVPARVLPQPRAQFADGPMELRRGKWNTQRFVDSPNMPIKWAIVAVPPDGSAARDFKTVADELPSFGKMVGVQFDPEPLKRRATFAELRNAFSDFVRQGIQLAVFILYDNKCYSEIKRLGDLEVGLKTQCVKSQTLRKRNVLPNLLLKINGKLGGVNWIVKDLRRNDDLLMVLGADVTHPGPTRGDELRKSVAAVIGSLTPDLMQYAAVIRQQNTTKLGDKARQEVIVDMESIITDLLKAFGRRNNERLPEKIMFYRDGVSESEFQTVLHEELRAIQRACRLLRPNYEPAITFIVVQKRHHIRFKPMDPRARNVDPGTVVDREVTHASEFDFFLCSQEGIQGTSKPAHYHVLYDDSNWGSDALQSFTYYLCHAYQRCCRSVSYPAPTFYSHLAAFHARDWLKGCKQPEDLFVDKNKFKWCALCTEWLIRHVNGGFSADGQSAGLSTLRTFSTSVTNQSRPQSEAEYYPSQAYAVSYDPRSQGEIADALQRPHNNKASRDDSIAAEIYNLCVNISALAP
ncbi:hypothetical protein SprV_0501816900 [Sparganum proliferum]